jgi:DNA-binding PadR family transcriptional regulator
MFGRHHHHGRHAFGRGPFGFHGHREGHHEDHRGHGGGRMGGGRMGGRFFEQGDLRLVVLKLIADKPSHGYELIKAVEEAAGGAYAPSPGVIYPTLTLLEDLGYAAVQEAGGRKLYTITPEGEAYLAENAPMVGGLFERMAAVAARSQAFSPQILRARENLKTALRFKLTHGALTTEQVARIAEALDAAARAVEQA